MEKVEEWVRLESGAMQTERQASSGSVEMPNSENTLVSFFFFSIPVPTVLCSNDSEKLPNNLYGNSPERVVTINRLIISKWLRQENQFGLWFRFGSLLWWRTTLLLDAETQFSSFSCSSCSSCSPGAFVERYWGWVSLQYQQMPELVVGRRREKVEARSR